MKNTLILTALCAGLALPLAAQEEVTSDTVVATVNGEEITVTHVIDIRRQLPEQYQNLPNDVLFTGIIDQLIQQRVLAGSVSEPPAWVEATMENTRASVLAQIFVEETSETEFSEADIEAAYEAQFGNFEGEQEYNASHILVETEEEALDLVSQLEDGADFASLAQEFSTGPSGPRGGELGWFGAGMMVPPFEEAVVALEVGAISAPVQTQFGWHVITLNDTRTPEPPALAEVRADLEGQLRSEALQARITELEAAATVERTEGLDPNLLDTLNIFDE
ncbi:MAG: peptidylprolyl isomerase [Pseudomonadota bacterium]